MTTSTSTTLTETQPPLQIDGSTASTPHDSFNEANMSTFNSQATSSSTSSQKFNLDENDTRDILVYKYRTGYEISCQKALCAELDKQPNLRCSRKPIPRGASRIEVKNNDLFNEPERTAYAKYPNARSSLASVGLPRGVYWRRLLMGHFTNLYIVSPESTPSASANNSPEDSQGPSPSNTWDVAKAQQEAIEKPGE